LRRIVSADGRSRAYVNGQAMPVQAVRQLGATLLDVHGQMEYQSLVRRAAQRELLDAFGGHTPLVDAVATAWRTLCAAQAERDRAAASAQDREARLELLKYHLEELSALDPQADEVEALGAERQRLSQRGRLAQGAGEIGQLLREAEDTNAEQALSRAASLARTLADLDPRLAPTAQLLDEALIALRESADNVERYLADLDADPARQEWVEQRLAALEAVARKHRTEPAALPALRRELAAELERLETLEASLEQLDANVAAARQAFAA